MVVPRMAHGAGMLVKLSVPVAALSRMVASRRSMAFQVQLRRRDGCAEIAMAGASRQNHQHSACLRTDRGWMCWLGSEVETISSETSHLCQWHKAARPTVPPQPSSEQSSRSRYAALGRVSRQLSVRKKHNLKRNFDLSDQVMGAPRVLWRRVGDDSHLVKRPWSPADCVIVSCTLGRGTRGRPRIVCRQQRPEPLRMEPTDVSEVALWCGGQADGSTSLCGLAVTSKKLVVRTCLETLVSSSHAVFPHERTNSRGRGWTMCPVSIDRYVDAKQRVCCGSGSGSAVTGWEEDRHRRRCFFLPASKAQTSCVIVSMMLPAGKFAWSIPVD